MAARLISKEWNIGGGYRKTYIVDTKEEVESLPSCDVGSIAIVVDKDGPVYMVNASGEWKEQ